MGCINGWFLGVMMLVPGQTWCQQSRSAKTTFSQRHIVWDRSTVKQVSPAGESANYARMIQLKNKQLACVYESKGIKFTTSADGGNTWTRPITVAENIAGVTMNVPDLLELNDQSLLVSYNPRPRAANGITDTTRHFAIRTIKSYDGGKTWKDGRVVYQAGYKFDDGCWEPSQIQLPDGEIQLFFSNEGIYTQSNEQNISLFRSHDNGLTWTAGPEIASFTTHHRDGMPVPLILNGTKQILFSIEDNAGGQFKPSIIRNSFSQNWKTVVGRNSRERNYALSVKLPDSVYAGAPFIRQLHSGALILSYQCNLSRNHNWELSSMRVAVGDNTGHNFVNTEEPFKIPLNKSALWNSLCVLNDDTIIAITSTNAYSNHTAIWMIKGHLTTRKLTN